MGLAASQARYLTLSARKNDLEFAAQTISSRRLQLAYKTAEIARQYSDGMNNKQIKVAKNVSVGSGTMETKWEQINFDNLLESVGAVIWGIDGRPYSYEDDQTNVPYIYEHRVADGTPAEGEEQKYKWEQVTSIPTGANMDDYRISPNPDYKSDGGMDIESLLVSGKACVLDQKFAKFLMKFYNPSTGKFTVPTSAKDATGDCTNYDGETKDLTFDQMKDYYIEAYNDSHIQVDIDWRSDITGKMEHKYFTEDDEAVQAKYELETAEIQAQDKRLELEIKNIETQHKAIETELESVQKVIQGNIEKTFKIFS